MVRAVFFDKDGVLNKLVDHNGKLTAPWTIEELIFSEYSKESVQLVKARGYMALMVTNQPDVNEGHMEAYSLFDIINMNEKYLGVDDVRVAMERKSNDYKPNTGMIDYFVEKYKIDLSQSFMIGDTWRDVVCGHKAGLTTYYIGNPEKDYVYDPPEEWKDIKPDYVTTDVLSACMNIVFQRMEIEDEIVR